MGNSEVGHMVLGAGRVIHQDFSRINSAVENGDFGQNPEITETLNAVSRTDGTLHVLGLLSPWGCTQPRKAYFCAHSMRRRARTEKSLLARIFRRPRHTPAQRNGLFGASPSLI
jgi:2,3-bisphosphoglycerate-independent phosphoglycerate mutase